MKYVLNNLTNLMTLNGLTQEKLAERSNLSVRTIQNAVALKEVSANTRASIAKALDVTNFSLLTQTEDNVHSHKELEAIKFPKNILDKHSDSRATKQHLYRHRFVSSVIENYQSILGPFGLVSAIVLVVLLKSWFDALTPIYLVIIFFITFLSVSTFFTMQFVNWKHKVDEQIRSHFDERLRIQLATDVKNSLDNPIFNIIEHTSISLGPIDIEKLKRDWLGHAEALLHPEFEVQVKGLKYFYIDDLGYENSFEGLTEHWKRVLTGAKLREL